MMRKSSAADAHVKLSIKDAVTMRLAEMINGTKRQGTPGGSLSTVTPYLTPSTAEYFYLNSGHIHRAINTRVNGLLRNGFVVNAENSGDQSDLDEMIQAIPFDSIVSNWTRNAEIYGNSYLEPYDGKDGIEIVEIPPSEMEYQKDTAGKILYKDGFPQGFVQKRDGADIATWDLEEIAHLKFIAIGGSDVGISSIQAAVSPATQAGLIRSKSAEAFSRALNVIQVSIDTGSADDILEVSDALSDDFTSQSAYVTNERYTIKSVGNASSAIDVSKYIEPNIAEIAAAFDMPIEMVSATATLRIDEFAARYTEWLQSLRMRQQVLADTLEKQIFERIVENPVKVIFNDPAPLNTNEFIKAIGFAKQAEALTTEQVAKALVSKHVFDATVFGDGE